MTENIEDTKRVPPRFIRQLVTIYNIYIYFLIDWFEIKLISRFDHLNWRLNKPSRHKIWLKTISFRPNRLFNIPVRIEYYYNISLTDPVLIIDAAAVGPRFLPRLLGPLQTVNVAAIGDTCFFTDDSIIIDFFFFFYLVVYLP